MNAKLEDPATFTDSECRVITWYELRGRPHITRFGITVDSGGQYAWLDDPRQLVGS
ncbi:hypothetical protein ACFW6F_23720 [Streptomyces sp. NPDC058746]|uniref:hypothetical protein n=1 Tax=Streptomyces sp. NPDC058746 TaxID=3346622 RepID=UPI0036C87716